MKTLNDIDKGIELAKGMDRHEIDVLDVADCSGRDVERQYQRVALFCFSFVAKFQYPESPLPALKVGLHKL